MRQRKFAANWLPLSEWERKEMKNAAVGFLIWIVAPVAGLALVALGLFLVLTPLIRALGGPR